MSTPNDRLQAIFTTTRDGVWVVGLDGRLLEVNDAACAMLGFSREELLGKSVPDIEAIHDLEQIRRNHQEIRQNAEFVRFETRHRARDGRLIDVEISASFIHSEAQTLVFIRDIEERKTLRDALLALAGPMAGLQGEAFYTAVSQHLVEAVGLDYAFVGLLNPVEQQIEVLAGWAIEQPITPFTYALAGTPCADVLSRGYAIYPAGVQTLFPHDELLAQMGIQSCLGCALNGKDGQPIGILVGLGRQPLLRAEAAERLLEVFEDRVAAEMLRVQAEQRMQLFTQVFEHSSEAIVILGHQQQIVDANAAFTQLCGYALEEVRGWGLDVLVASQTPQETLSTIFDLVQETAYWQGELWGRHQDGSVYPGWAVISQLPDKHGQLSHFAVSFTSLAERKAVEAQLARLEHQDALTGLLNRFSLESRLAQALESARRDGGKIAVLWIDMDRFKNINDMQGYRLGDQLLQSIAQRLRESVCDGDILARQGGDEFVLALTQVESPLAALQMAQRVLQALSAPYLLGSETIHCTFSIGIAMYPGDAEAVHELLLNADTAMYTAKAKGLNQIRFFTPRMMASVQGRVSLESDLRRAIAEQQFVLHYQPQVRACDAQVVGVEALVRWEHPRQGLLSPEKFIGLAEESGLIEFIGEWVLHTACRQLADWQQRGIQIRMSVNLSAQQLRNDKILHVVQSCLQQFQLDPACLELEVTESAMMANPEYAISLLSRLRDAGVRLAVDDFGTGYSSLAYLKRLPVHTLKLDRSFVKDIETHHSDAAICAATIGLAHTLGLEVVAEGVETLGQSQFLAQRHNCDILQGYFFGRPVPANQVVFSS